MSSLQPTQAQYWPQQSPIELHKCDSFYVKVQSNYFRWKYNGAPYKGAFKGHKGHENFVLDDIHGCQKPPVIKLGKQKAQLVKIHLHNPSEHDLDGKNKTGEIHLIHEIEAPKSGSQLIVLGVFFEEDTTAPDKNAFAPSSSDGGDGVEFSIDPRKLMPDTDQWYRYEGSLTSEPFTEFVSWLVFVQPLRMSSNDLAMLTQHANQPERGVQPINRRMILRNFR